MRHTIYFSGGDAEMKKLIRRCVNATLTHQKAAFPCEVSILITDDEEIRALNADFRGIDKATDVLSFPACDLIPGEPLPEEFLDPETERFPLGDMAISVERAEAQALEFGHSAEREAGYLSVHSILHLLGYDHEDEEDKRLMRKQEDEIIEKLGLFRK